MRACAGVMGCLSCVHIYAVTSLSQAWARHGVLMNLAGVRGHVVGCGQGELHKVDAVAIAGMCARHGVPSRKR